MRPSLLALILATTLSALALPAQARRSAPAPEPRLPTESLRLPIIPQAADFSCGAAATLSVLLYWGAFEGMEADLYPLLGTKPDDGTRPEKIVQFARRRGLKADLRLWMTLQDLRHELAWGSTVILDIQAWKDEGSGLDWADIWDKGHYVVLVGMDEHYAYVMDPVVQTSYAYVPLRELMERWHDYDDRRGYRIELYQLGIVIKGTEPMKAYPGPLTRLE